MVQPRRLPENLLVGSRQFQFPRYFRTPGRNPPCVSILSYFCRALAQAIVVHHKGSAPVNLSAEIAGLIPNPIFMAANIGPISASRGKSMPFGNFQVTRLGQDPSPSQGYDFGRRSPSRSGGRSAQQVQRPVRESSEGYSGKSKTDLTVLTAEGDRVTISLAAQVKYAASSKTGPGGSSQSVAASSSSQLRVAVEGDLNETELKDLGTLLANLAQATSEAQSADVSSTTTPPATAPDTGFASLSSLAAFAYRYKETVEAGTLVQTRG